MNFNAEGALSAQVHKLSWLLAGSSLTMAQTQVRDDGGGSMSRQHGVKEGSGHPAGDDAWKPLAARAGVKAEPERLETQKAGEGAANLLQRRPIMTLLAAAGMIGPILFTATFLVQEFFRRGEYSPLAEPVSALEAGPNGWVQQVNFVVFGIMTIAYAVGLHGGMRRSQAGVVGPAILGWSGVGLVLAAVFPLREDAAGVTYDPTGLHFVNGLIFFLSIGVGLIVISRRMASDPRWRSLATYALATGITLLVMFVAIRVLVVPDDAPFHPWAGLAQRAVLAVWFPCFIVLARRLMLVARTAAGTAHTHREVLSEEAA